MNVIARLEYELAYYDSAVHRFNHYTTRTPPNMKAMVGSLDGDTVFFDIVVSVVQGNTLAPYLLIFWLADVIETSIERKWFDAKEDKKQMVSHRYYLGCRQRRWSCASCKYTCSRLIFSVKPGVGSKKHWSLQELGVHVFSCILLAF